MRQRHLLSISVKGILVLLLIALFLPLFALGGQAQQDFDLTGRGEGYTAVLYDGTSGLPTSEANDIVQTPDGFIWIGAYSGLIRYDGTGFYRYSSGSGVASVVSLFCDSRGRLWIGTNDSGAAMLYNEQFVHYGKNEGLRSASIRALCEDRDGNILIASTKGLAYVDTEGTLQLIDDPQINNEYVCDLCADKDGVIYGVTLSGAILTIENRRISGYYSAEEMALGMINTVFPDPEGGGRIYVGTQDAAVYRGTLSSDMKDAVKMAVDEGTSVNEVNVCAGVVWACNDHSVGYFDDGGRFVRLLDLPMTNSIDHVMEDMEGNLWFTSSRQGVMKIVANRFHDISNRAALDKAVVNSTCLDGDDLYIGTDSGLFAIDRQYRSLHNAATEYLAATRIRCIQKTGDGRLWFCTYGTKGLVCYDPEKDTVFSLTADDGMPSNRVRSLTVLNNGDLAVATNAGLAIVRNDAVVALYGASKGISNLEILCVEEAEDGVIYLGSDGDGIYRIEGSRVSRIGADDGLSSEVVMRIKKDLVDPSLFWIVTSNSLAYIKNDKVTTVTSFPYSNNFDLFYDRSDRLWVLGSNGIYVAKRQELLGDRVAEYTHYDAESGMHGVSTANSFSCIADDGMLFLACSTGVVGVNIYEETGSVTDDLLLTVPFVRVDDRVVWTNGQEEIHIPSDCKRLDVYAGVMTYTLSDPHISYVLEGFDDAAIVTTKKSFKEPSYTNLSGGTYTFVVSLLDEVTGKVEKTVSLRIVKDRAIYEYFLFNVLVILLLAALIIGAIVLFFRRKTKALMRRREEDKKLISEMTRVFSGCVDMKDAYTKGHSARVAQYTAMFARRMGKSEEEVEEIYNIALLHDIGKISIPDSILNKPGRLTDEEFAVMKTHASRGYEILKDIKIAPTIALGAGYHHEKYDGTGYPAGLKGDEIPEIAQMIAVADAFDAMYSTRPYRTRMPLEKVVAEIRRVSGTQLSPKVVEVFMQLYEEGAFNEPPADADAPKPTEEAEKPKGV